MPDWRGKKSKWGHLVCFALVFTAGLFSLLLKKQQSNGYWSLHFSSLCMEISGTQWGQHWPDLLFPSSFGGYGQHCRCWAMPHGDLNLSSPHCAGDAMLKAVLEESLKLFWSYLSARVGACCCSPPHCPPCRNTSVTTSILRWKVRFSSSEGGGNVGFSVKPQGKCQDSPFLFCFESSYNEAADKMIGLWKCSLSCTSHWAAISCACQWEWK